MAIQTIKKQYQKYNYLVYTYLKGSIFPYLYASILLFILYKDKDWIISQVNKQNK